MIVQRSTLVTTTILVLLAAQSLAHAQQSQTDEIKRKFTATEEGHKAEAKLCSNQQNGFQSFDYQRAKDCMVVKGFTGPFAFSYTLSPTRFGAVTGF